MRLFLIRHGETVDNVAKLYAGTRDSALTNHGVLQAEKLGKFLAQHGHLFAHIFSSDLQRAFKTANAIRQEQIVSRPDAADCVPEVRALPILREQDFGFYEGKAFNARPRQPTGIGKDDAQSSIRETPDFQDVESKESMARRMRAFLSEQLFPVLFAGVGSHDHAIAVVSHGIILSQLWKCLLNMLPANCVVLGPNVTIRGGGSTPLEYIGGWSNTGYLELEIQQMEANMKAIGPATSSMMNDPPSDVQTSAEEEKASALQRLRVIIHTVNGRSHLASLKRTKGVGSSEHDENQKTIESFFHKKQKV